MRTELKKLRWWDLIWNKEFRHARRLMKKGGMAPDNFVQVEGFDNGGKLMMPPELVAQWKLIPEEDRAAIMAAMNEQMNEQRARKSLKG